MELRGETMKAYLQTSESGFEVDLEVHTPDPDDGTKVVLLDYIEVSKALGWLAANGSSYEEGQIWVRLVPEDTDAHDIFEVTPNATD
jgi:hypothetical protein